MNLSRSSPVRFAWLIVLALTAAAGAGYGLWLDATTDPLCHPTAHSPGALGTAALPVLAAMLAGVVGRAFGQRKRVIAGQAGVALLLTGALMLLVAFVFVGAHHCFD